MTVIYQKTKGLQDTELHYCPGCAHGIVHKLIGEVLEELTAGMTLLPGTVIATGTPAGVGMGFDPPKFLKSGDVVECEIEGIGVLRNTVE